MIKLNLFALENAFAEFKEHNGFTFKYYFSFEPEDAIYQLAFYYARCSEVTHENVKESIKCHLT